MRTCSGKFARAEEMGSATQQYCLRWNNHRSNLLLVFEHLFQTESFTDVTLACDGSSIKCHKMVLAACSSYFQQLFMENDCRHPIVILKDIRYSEIKAILEYMYKGEVNVAQDQLAGLLKAAETLKVKGLVEDHQNAVDSPSPTNQSPYPPAHSSADFQPSPVSFPKANSLSTKVPSTESSSYDSSFNASSNLPERTSLPFPIWSSSTGTGRVPLSPSPRLNVAVNNFEPTQTEPVLLKKKRYLSNNKDTPILRTVLGHTSLQTTTQDSNASQATALHQTKSINYSLSSNTSNGPIEHNDKVIGSPYHFMEESFRNADNDKSFEDNHSFNLDSESKHGIATYVPTQKPEWKRYKQYTRNDIMSAIDAVRGGLSALQAARKYGVPSRTLYDKVKKLGITTNRPFRKGNFPMSPYQGMSIKSEDGSSYSPEEPLDVSGAGNGAGNGSGIDEGHGERMDCDREPSFIIKTEHSPNVTDDKDSSILGTSSPPNESQYSGTHGGEFHGSSSSFKPNCKVPLNDNVTYETSFSSNSMATRNDDHDEANENGSENCSSTSPRDRDALDPEEIRSSSD